MKDAAKLILLAVVIWLIFLSIGLAHDGYHNWINQRHQPCCNNLDCAPVEEQHERQTATGTEILVEGKWCPVESWHYLLRGKSPDWSAAHACVLRPFHPGNTGDPCARFICYSPRPGS